jgi:hypothetical protein
MAHSGVDTPRPPRKSAGLVGMARSALGRTGDRMALAAHRLADKLDIVPSEFGREGPVDEADARSVRAEWLRHLKLWSAYNPEEVFALKVGGVLLACAGAGRWLVIAVVF